MKLKERRNLVAKAIWKIVCEVKSESQISDKSHDPTDCKYCLGYADSIILAYKGKKE